MLTNDMSRGVRRRCLGLAAGALVTAGSAMLPAADASAAQKFFNCTPVDIAVHTKSRIHVRCAPGDGPILFFAFPLTSASDAEANRLLSLAGTAYALRKRLQVLYEPTDLSGAKFGCINADCRVIVSLLMF